MMHMIHMKKTACLLMTIILLTAVPAAFASNAGTVSQDLRTVIETFDSVWETDAAEIDIKHSEPYFYVRVYMYGCGPVWSDWVYRCVYDHETDVLICDGNGIRKDYWFEDEVEESTEYTDGSAVFAVNDDGQLIWEDMMEDEGNGFLFEKMGNYGGIWDCGDTEVELVPYAGFYDCLITRQESDGTSAVWDYSCEFDAASCTLICRGGGYKYEQAGSDAEDDVSFKDVYKDGAADFSMDENGCLVWNDHRENAGAGLVFTRKITEEPFWTDIYPDTK